MRPKKSLGQHFLRDENIARRIVGAVDPRPEDVILEIGPGEGALTRHLAPLAGRLIAVDIDGRLIDRLRKEFPPGRIEFLHADILDVDPASVAGAGGRLRVAGNIPYNITSPILFHLLDHRLCIRDCTLMVQKEVAVRLAASPGSKDYGVTSVMTQLFADVRRLFDVPPGAFFPPPRVTSSVVQMVMLPAPRYAMKDEEFTRRMIRSVFGKRRKTLRASLRYFDPRITDASVPEVDLRRRPEELSVEELVSLGNMLYERVAQQVHP